MADDSLSLSLIGSAAQPSPAVNDPHARPPFGSNRRKLGVGLRKSSNGKVAAQIHVSTDTIRWLGIFDTEEEAALAYNEAARSLHGLKARTNSYDPFATAPPLSHALGVVGTGGGAGGSELRRSYPASLAPAALAYNEAARSLRGPKARTNFSYDPFVAAPPLSHALVVVGTGGGEGGSELWRSYPASLAPAAPPPPSAVRLECMGFHREIGYLNGDAGGVLRDRERRDKEESAVKKPFLFDLNLPAPQF